MTPKTFSASVLLATIMAGGILFLEAIPLPLFDNVISSAIGCPVITDPNDDAGGGGGPDCTAECCTNIDGPDPDFFAGSGLVAGVRSGSGGVAMPAPGAGRGGGSGGGSEACCPDTTTGNPINASTGEKYLSVTDVYIEGPIPIAITRSYGNQRKYDSPFGHNWMINYYARIESIDSNKLTYITHQAGVVEYPRVGSLNKFALQGNSSHYFEYNSTLGGYDLVVPGKGLIYHFKGQWGNDKGRLKHIRNDHGNQVSFQHSSTTGFITRITDTLGRDIRFYYNASNRLSRIWDITGNRNWYYYYSASNDLIRVEYPDVPGYSGSNRLKYRYAYDSNHNLTHVYDPQNQLIVRNFYTYDSVRNVYKVYKQQRAGGERQLTHDAVNNVTIVVDPEGNTTKIYYNDGGLKTKEVVFTADPQANPNQYVTEYFYDELGRNTLTILPEGNCIAYTFDGNNMMTGVYRKTSPDDPNDPEHPNVIATLYEYDEVHYTKAATVTDAMGNETHYEYTLTGKVTQITHPEIQTPDGPVTAVEEYTYTATGKIDTYTNPDGVVTQYVYCQTTGFLLEVIEDYGQGQDNLNLATLYAYDNLGRVTSVTTPDGATTQYEYNALDQVTKVIGPAPFEYETLYAYDHNGNRKEVKRQTSDPQNPWQINQFTYDQWGKLTQTKDALGNETFYEYDKNERRKLVRDALGNETRYTYDERGLLLTVTDPNDKETVYAYDLNGNRISITDTEGKVTHYDYDGLDRLVRITDAEGHYRIRTLDKLGRVIQEIAYDCNATPEDEQDDEALMQTRFAYNQAGDLIEYVIMADAEADAQTTASPDIDNVTRYAYAWANGPMVEETRYFGGDGVNPATAAVTTHLYDAVGRRIQTEDPDNNLTDYIYDAVGRVVRVQQLDIDPVGSNDLLLTTDLVYDELGRMVYRIEKPENPDAASDASWQTTEYIYDALDNVIQEIRPDGTATVYAYDLQGRKTEMIVDPNGIHQITEYGYDALGRQNWIAGYADSDNANTRQLTEYEYDDLGRITKITYPDAATIEYAYTNTGKVYRRTDQRGWETFYSYDDVYNMTQKEVKIGGNTIALETFTYDGLGRMLSAEKQQGQDFINESVFAYNALGRISDAWETILDEPQKHIQYAYDNAGHRIQTVYPDGSSIERTNTWDGRIDTLWQDATTLAAYDYIGSRVARRAYPAANVTTDMLYDNLGRVTDIDAGANLVKFGYQYVANSNNIATITFDHRPDTPYNAFDYDHLDRLTEAEYLVGVLSEGEVFGMDDLGNRTTVNLRSGANQVYATDTPNLTNRYTAVGGQPLDYDAAGNLTGDPDGYRYVYDYENRTTRIYKLSGQTEIDVARYAYDALGRRIEARSFADGQVDAVRRYWYNDQWQVLTQGLWSQAYASFTLSRNYIYGNTIDEVLGFEWVVNGTPGMRYYYLHDHLYSPAVMLTEYGVVERYEYDAYGRRSVMTPGFAHRNNSHYLSDLGLTGREIDELDLAAAATPRLQHMHYRHRDYNPQLGRFMQHDSLGINPSYEGPNFFGPEFQYYDSRNLYEYVTSRPLLAIDPFGLMDPIMFPQMYKPRYPRHKQDPWIERCHKAAKDVHGRVHKTDKFMRHCTASCELTKEMGNFCAWLMGTAYELSTGRNFDQDMHNNKLGRSCADDVDECGGKSYKSCEECCEANRDDQWQPPHPRIPCLDMPFCLPDFDF